jgi:hypothetical protein
MSGQIRLFDKIDGLLVEVSAAEVDAMRAGRRFSTVSLVIDVLWTAGEEDARDAEEAADAAQRIAYAEAEAARLEALGKHRKQIEKKLEKFGLTLGDLDALKG